MATSMLSRLRVASDTSLAWMFGMPINPTKAVPTRSVASSRRVPSVVLMVTVSTEAQGGDAYERFPEQPPDAVRLHQTFERFGLPAELA